MTCVEELTNGQLDSILHGTKKKTETVKKGTETTIELLRRNGRGDSRGGGTGGESIAWWERLAKQVRFKPRQRKNE